MTSDPAPARVTKCLGGGAAAAAVTPPHLVVLTGMSGAGKQLAAKYFEDMGWRVVDNLPPRLLPGLAADPQVERLCVVCDVRSGEGLQDLLPALETLEAGEIPRTLLFLESSDAALIQRFKETRRTHPLFLGRGGIGPAIAAERDLLGRIKERADKVIDTTDLSPLDLRAQLLEHFADPDRREQPLTVTVSSFGFKHGIPLDADLVFDVRFLANPHYVDALRPFDGRDGAVEKYVMDDERTGCFLERLYDLVGWSLPQYVGEGKAYLTVAIGCTGGRHRSVVVAEKLTRFLRGRGYRVLTQHRDVERH
jgi:UPF0042 nucleotide-binding protein